MRVCWGLEGHRPWPGSIILSWLRFGPGGITSPCLALRGQKGPQSREGSYQGNLVVGQLTFFARGEIFFSGSDL